MQNITPLPLKAWEEGTKITEPGIYSGMPIQTYHGDCCAGPSFSSGILRRTEQKSLQHVWHESPLNPDAAPRVEKEAWLFGRAAHTLLLGESGFREDYLIRPETYVDDKTGQEKSWNGNAGVCRKWLANAALAGKSVLKADQIDAIRGMAESLAAHPTIRQGILNGLVEKSIFWRESHEVTMLDGEVRQQALWMKSRMDNVPIDSNMIVDLKSCDDASPQACRSAIGEYGYHQQLALGADGIEATTGRRITDFVLVFVEKKAPYAINIKPVSATAIEYGRRQNLRAARKLAQAVATGQWPGYDDDEVTAELPNWLATRLAFEADKGLLPPLPDAEEAF